MKDTITKYQLSPKGIHHSVIPANRPKTVGEWLNFIYQSVRKTKSK